MSTNPATPSAGSDTESWWILCSASLTNIQTLGLKCETPVGLVVSADTRVLTLDLSSPCRFVEWIPEVPTDMRWLYGVAGDVYRQAWKGMPATSMRYTHTHTQRYRNVCIIYTSKKFSFTPSHSIEWEGLSKLLTGTVYTFTLYFKLRKLRFLSIYDCFKLLRWSDLSSTE